MAFARFVDVSITFFKDKGDRPFTAVENFDLTIEEGEFFCLLGPSGCGKTMALNMLAGFDRPRSGRLPATFAYAPFIFTEPQSRLDPALVKFEMPK